MPDTSPTAPDPAPGPDSPPAPAWFASVPRRDWSDYERDAKALSVFRARRRWPTIASAAVNGCAFVYLCIDAYCAGRGIDLDWNFSFLLVPLAILTFLGGAIGTLLFTALALYHRHFIRTALVSTAAMILLWFTPYLLPAAPFVLGIQHRTGSLAELGAACRAVLQVPTASSIREGNDPRLPPAIRALRPSYFSIFPEQQMVMIEFGGGFRHFGYMFERATTGPGHWILSRYGEEPDDLQEVARFTAEGTPL